MVHRGQIRFLDVISAPRDLPPFLLSTAASQTSGKCGSDSPVLVLYWHALFKHGAYYTFMALLIKPQPVRSQAPVWTDPSVNVASVRLFYNLSNFTLLVFGTCGFLLGLVRFVRSDPVVPGFCNVGRLSRNVYSFDRNIISGYCLDGIVMDLNRHNDAYTLPRLI